MLMWRAGAGKDTGMSPGPYGKSGQHQMLLLQLGISLATIAEPRQSGGPVVGQKFPVQKQSRGEFLSNITLD